jgi:hypothetical protein
LTHFTAAHIKSGLAILLIQMSRLPEAENLIRSAEEAIPSTPGGDDPEEIMI